ncbi:hypothetical protein [Photorhabdus viridis]|uniref:hypothetical protein n=1 Tax=Photorhabdus viridis TaxID=3163327 RepID=UPI0033077BAC
MMSVLGFSISIWQAILENSVFYYFSAEDTVFWSKFITSLACLLHRLILTVNIGNSEQKSLMICELTGIATGQNRDQWIGCDGNVGAITLNYAKPGGSCTLLWNNW